MSDVVFSVKKWRENLTRAKDCDAWGQYIEASEKYYRLSEEIMQESLLQQTAFNSEQKKLIGKVASCLQLRSRSLQNFTNEEITFADIQLLSKVLENILHKKTEDFPIKVVITAEEVLRNSEKVLTLQDPTPPSFYDVKHDGTLLPRICPEENCHRLTINIIKIGLKDPLDFIDPFIIVSAKDIYGSDLTLTQSTSTTNVKDDCYVHFNCDVELQRTIEKLPQGAAIFFELKHFKPKKNRFSTKCWTFMELDEIRPGVTCLELYKKPTNLARKRLRLLTVKPLYLHVFLTIHDNEE